MSSDFRFDAFSSSIVRLAQDSIDRQGCISACNAERSEEAEFSMHELRAALLSLGSGPSSDDLAGDDDPFVLGRFMVFGERGRGGFGIVLKAYDPDLQRDVALKLPRPERILQGEDPEETLREARLAAKLEHTGIVPVFETGRWGPIWYIASAYCSGPSLREWLIDNSAQLKEATIARLVKQIAEIVNYAHSRGVLHLDLKPDNILLKESENKTDPDLLITDFGLSKANLADSDLQRRAGGTLHYMAPEQRLGDEQKIGVCSDVYALGAILRDMVCAMSYDGSRGRSALELDRSRDLVAVTQRCLAEDIEDRYASAHEVAVDLGRYLRGEAVSARPVSWPLSMLRWIHRKPAMAGALAVLAVTVTTSVIAITILWRHAEMNLRRFKHEARITKIADEKIEQSVLNLALIAQKARLGAAGASEDYQAELRSLRSFLIDMQEWSARRLDKPGPESALTAAMKSLALIDSIQSQSSREVEQAYHDGVAEWQRLVVQRPSEMRWRRGLAIHILTYEMQSLDRTWISWRGPGRTLSPETIAAIDLCYAELLIDVAARDIARRSYDPSYGMLLAAIEILKSPTVDREESDVTTRLQLNALNLAAEAAVGLSRRDEAEVHRTAAQILASMAPVPDTCNPHLAYHVSQTLKAYSHGLRRSGKHDQANEVLSRAIAYCTNSIQKNECDPAGYHLLGQLTLRLARHFKIQGRVAEAAVAYVDAIESLSDGLTLIPARSRRLVLLRATLQSDLGILLLELDDFDAAVRALVAANMDFSDIQLRKGDSRGIWLASIRAMQSLGKAYQKLGRETESANAYTASVRQLNEMRQFTNHPKIETYTRISKAALVQLNEVRPL